MAASSNEPHEDERAAQRIENNKILEFEIDLLNCLADTQSFVKFGLAHETFQFHLIDRVAFSRFHRIGLHRKPKAAIMIDDGAGRNLISVDLGHCLEPSGRRHPRPRQMRVDRQKSGSAKPIGQDCAYLFSDGRRKNAAAQTRMGINT
jgi:hypothetical protein